MVCGAWATSTRSSRWPSCPSCTGGRRRSANPPGVAVYAWAFPVPEGLAGPPGASIPACGWRRLYDLACRPASRRRTGRTSSRGGTFELPFGRLDVASTRAALRAGTGSSIGRPDSELEVRGWHALSRAGLGALRRPPPPAIEAVAVGRGHGWRRMKVQVTALLRYPRGPSRLVESRPLTAALELYLAWDAEAVSIAGERSPRGRPHRRRSAAFLHRMCRSSSSRCCGLLGRISGAYADRPPLISSTPYKRGLIPSCSCTARSRACSDGPRCTTGSWPTPRSAAGIQFWFFQYDSGNPYRAVVASACASR
jgi:hypothetical protein